MGRAAYTVALRAAQLARDDPSTSMDVVALAVAAGVSVRTLERIFLAETAMSFGKWRQQARLLHALTSLAQGVAVKRVARDVGYQTPSAFIAMFKKALGATPGRFLQR